MWLDVDAVADFRPRQNGGFLMSITKDDGFTARALMAMATDLAEAEAHVARMGVSFRALAKEHGVAVPAPLID
jgi:hypothetical protein